MFKYLFADKVKNILLIIFITAYSISSTLIAFVLSSILDYATDGTINELIRGSIFAVLYLILYIGLSFIYNRLKYIVLKESTTQLKSSLFSAIMRKNIVEYEKSNSAAYMNELTNNVNMLEELYFKNMIDTAALIISFLTAVISVIMLQPMLLLIMIIMALITTAITNVTGKRLEESTVKYTESAKEYSVILKEYFTGFRLIKTFRLFDAIEKTHTTGNDNTEERKRLNRNNILLCVCSGEFIGFFSTILVMALAAGFAIKGIVTVGAVFAVGHLMGRITSPISSMSNIIVNFKSVMPIKKNFLEMINSVSSEDEGIMLADINKDICFKDAGFSYDGSRNALNQLNLTISKGKRYAIAGGSGSGKTTLFLLLLGYYKNYMGSIKYDGTEVRDINLSSIYQIVGTLSQETFIFEDTLRNNLTLFGTYTDDEILSAAKKAGLADYIKALPDGLNSGITEGGRNLSGGERQRVSLTRILLKDYPILLFDELTTGLDSETAYMIEKYILSLHGKTMLTITHRLSPELLKQYDGIIVLRNGQLVEMGTFDELVKMKGYFDTLLRIDES